MNQIERKAIKEAIEALQAMIDAKACLDLLQAEKRVSEAVIALERLLQADSIIRNKPFISTEGDRA